MTRHDLYQTQPASGLGGLKALLPSPIHYDHRQISLDKGESVLLEC